MFFLTIISLYIIFDFIEYSLEKEHTVNLFSLLLIVLLSFCFPLFMITLLCLVKIIYVITLAL